MIDLNEILIFAKVAETGSFSGAAQKLDMPKSTVSRKIADLEQRLGARLIQRTTRRLSLTDAGRAYFEHGARIVAELEEAERAVGNLQDGPRGKLRVTAPLNFGFLGAIAAGYLARYPEVELDLVCTDRVVNLVEEGFDVAIRARALGDSSLIARSLGPQEQHRRGHGRAAPGGQRLRDRARGGDRRAGHRAHPRLSLRRRPA